MRLGSGLRLSFELGARLAMVLEVRLGLQSGPGLGVSVESFFGACNSVRARVQAAVLDTTTQGTGHDSREGFYAGFYRVRAAARDRPCNGAKNSPAELRIRLTGSKSLPGPPVVWY